MITPFIQLLKELELNSTAEEVADTLWLASFLDPPAEEEVESPPKIAPRQYSVKLKASNNSLPSEPNQRTRSNTSSEEKKRSDVYLPNQDKRPIDAPTVRGLPLAAPTVPALPNTLEIERTLRPLMRRVPSRTHVVLDEEATVQRIADEGNWVPIMRPAPSRWLDAVLVVDESPSMVIWQETIVEWERLLKRLGAFRKVQSWGFMGDSDGEQIQLYAGIGPHADRSRGREPHELIDPYGQRLILVMSDCVSALWYQKAIIEMLESWYQKGPVAIVQMLPERLWSRTALGDAVRVDLRAPSAGPANRQLEVDSIWNWFDDEDDEQNASGLEAPAAEFPVPVVTLEARTLKPWAKSLAGSKLWIPGVLFSRSAFDESPSFAQESAPQSTTDTVSARQLFQRFKATTSPKARQLAGYLAAVPLTLPIMRIVQREMLPKSTPDHLAEVLLSGLIEKKTAYHPTIHAHDLRYDFVKGVRDLLLSTILISETVDVLDRVFKQISNFIDRKTGQGPDFHALIADPEAIDQIDFEAGDTQFATIATKVLRRLGGNYAKLAKHLEQRVESATISPDSPDSPDQADSESADLSESDMSDPSVPKTTQEQTRLESGEPLSHSLLAEFPERIALGESVFLRVWLSTNLKMEKKLPLGSKIDILVQAERSFALEGSSKAQLTVTDEEKTPSIWFKLRATEIGPARIHVLCSQGGQLLGAITLSPTTETSVTQQQPSPPPTPTISESESIQTEVWRSLKTEFPDKMHKGQEAWLLVWLARELGEELKQTVPLGSQLDTYVQIRRGFALVGQGQASLRVTDEDKTLPIQSARAKPA